MILICLVLNEIPKRRLKEGGYKELNYHKFVESGWELPSLQPYISEEFEKIIFAGLRYNP